MRALKRLRSVEILAGVSEGSYDIDYSYDVKGRIEKETITGVIERVTTYTYDAEDNISTETIVENGKTITKVYSYDHLTKNITKVQVTVA